MIREVCEAIANALAVIPELNVSPCVTDLITPPHAQVRPVGGDYRVTFRNGLTDYPFEIQVIVPRGDEQAAQFLLYDMMENDGGSSIRAVLEDTDDTLGGLVDFVAVDAVGDLEAIQGATDGVLYLARTWTLRVTRSN